MDAARLAQLRTALDAAERVARQLCACPSSALEAHPLLQKLHAIRAELDLLDSLGSALPRADVERACLFGSPGR